MITNHDSDAGERMKLLREIESENQLQLEAHPDSIEGLTRSLGLLLDAYDKTQDTRPAKIAALDTESAKLKAQAYIANIRANHETFPASCNIGGTDFNVTVYWIPEDDYANLQFLELNQCCEVWPIDLPPGIFMDCDVAAEYDYLQNMANVRAAELVRGDR